MERIRYKKITAALLALTCCLSSCQNIRDLYNKIESIEDEGDYQSDKSQSKDNRRDASTIKICSQNIGRLGNTKKNYSIKLKYLVSLMSKHNCSVVAIQEVINKDVANKLAKELSRQTKREFRSYLGKSVDQHITNGYLIAQDFGKLLGIKSYRRKSLPRIFKRGPSRYFVRGPLEAKFKLPFFNRNLVIYNIHLKSKYKGWKDPTKTNFEMQRAESAQAIRDIALKDKKNDFILIIGDRNNLKDKASDEILEGRIELEDLASGGRCKLQKNEYAKCSSLRKPKLLGLFGLLKERMPRRFKGTHKFKGKEAVLDEAFILPRDLSLVSSGKKLNIGTAGKYYKGSDHKMIWVEIRK